LTAHRATLSEYPADGEYDFYFGEAGASVAKIFDFGEDISAADCETYRVVGRRLKATHSLLVAIQAQANE